MKLAIILETKAAEKAWNALRFANTALKREHEVKFFLMGEAVEIEGITDQTYNVVEQLERFTTAGGHVLACGTCLRSRHLDDQTTCPISTMIDCVEMVEWADKTVTF
ncbi:DsrE/DsrF/TusD sulfur relay family protein [Enterococcus sp. CSURQ0835]|uniref:DsrE/DsrF/TusD sulfur relay family protein n=1 Tax=Enterococcus sp. CSURQ0835 TaxID=2681394 RepID=UPI001358DCEE|nr:DsrE family protein [Enterococcus sp. CSURQ0835]